MALRVLLADESATIKKVIQLSLQDLGVEVRSVNIGTDVIAAAEAFQPDIVLVDILLQKRNGYDVCQDLKSHDKLKSIPCVLMWSGFMNIDDKRIQKIGIEELLEKPFDTERLREIVHKCIPKTEKNVIGKFLEFPPLPKEGEKPDATEPINTSTTLDVKPNNNWSMESFENIQNFEQMPDLSLSSEPVAIPTAPIVEEDEKEEFVNVSLSPQKVDVPTPHLGEADDNQWVQKDISKFHLDLPPEAAFDEVSVDYKVNEDKFENTNFLLNFTDLQKLDETQSVNKTKSAIILPKAPEERFEEPAHEDHSEDAELAASVITMSQLQPIASFSAKTAITQEIALTPEPETEPVSESQLENLLRNQSKEVIERLVRKIVPELATEMIKKEIERLLSEPKV